LAAYPAYKLLPSVLSGDGTLHVNGGQLARLKKALLDPSVPFTGIAFLGDSITWGTGTMQGPSPAPRNGTLADPRDNLASQSYVNNLKRHFGETFMPKAKASTSNWSSSPAGESIVEFSSPTKSVRVSNQGINGASTSSYVARNLVASGDGGNFALLRNDNFVFVQLGTNDRGMSPRNPQTAQALTDSLVSMVNMLKQRSEVILMCANPSTVEPKTAYRFGMDAVRAATMEAAKICGVDFICNYTAFEGLDLGAYLADGLHPNVAGHLVTSNNIISAIEAA
jgi:lysophospholipase L1-like esterase